MTPPNSDYAFSLAVTSQFYFCGLPLRLDVEPVCQFTCLYCFSKARGGAQRPRGSQRQLADPDALRRRLDAVAAGRRRSVIDELLRRRTPVHFGGMADPFGPNPSSRRVAADLLSALADHSYPTVISTKAAEAADDEFLDTLRRGRCVVQFSFSTPNDELAEAIEVGASPPSGRLAAMHRLNDAGVAVTARLQPLLPGLEDEAAELACMAVEAGAAHVAVEHLKLPVERAFNGTNQLSRRLGTDLRELYARRGAERIGREYVLPPEHRLQTVLDLRERIHALGASFGAADTDLLLLSDGECCCSGVDLLGMDSHHRFTYLEAVRRGDPDRLRYEALDGVWRPPGTLSRFVNSRSRLPTTAGAGAQMVDYLRHNWNGRSNGPSPGMLWGVQTTEESDEHGMRIYRLASFARRVIDEAGPLAPAGSSGA